MQCSGYLLQRESMTGIRKVFFHLLPVVGIPVAFFMERQGASLLFKIVHNELPLRGRINKTIEE